MKRKYPDYYKWKHMDRIIESLTRVEILKLLGVNEETIRDVVSKVKPPYDFKEIRLGTFSNDDERLKLKSKQFKDKYFNRVRRNDMVFCSVFFIFVNKDGNLEMVMFRTKSKHQAGELEDKMSSVIVPRLKEIICAKEDFPLDEPNQYVSYDLHYYHYE